MMILSPSILAADFLNLGKDIKDVEEAGAQFLHFDVMDGVFVPSISFGMPVLSAIKKIAGSFLDVHLMIVNPEKYIEDFCRAGASILTVHYEACPHLHRVIQQIKGRGIKASVCLNPHTPVALLEDIIEELDMVLLMSVNPGFGGQKFIENTYRKATQLKELIVKRNAQTLIEVDGGVNFEIGQRLYSYGVDILVAGSFVFNSKNPVETIANLKQL